MTTPEKALANERIALQVRLQAIEKALALLKGGADTKRAPLGKRHISPKGLQRIRAAQKQRWDKFRKQQAQLAKEK